MRQSDCLYFSSLYVFYCTTHPANRPRGMQKPCMSKGHPMALLARSTAPSLLACKVCLYDARLEEG